MKGLLRSILINAVALWAVSQMLTGISFTKGYETLLVTAAVLGLVNIFARPLLNILFLPINVLTLGTFRWLINVVTLFLVTLLVSDFKIHGFYFPGYSRWGINLPSAEIGNLLALILISFLLSFLSGLLFWLVKK